MSLNHPSIQENLKHLQEKQKLQASDESCEIQDLPQLEKLPPGSSWLSLDNFNPEDDQTDSSPEYNQTDSIPKDDITESIREGNQNDSSPEHIQTDSSPGLFQDFLLKAENF